MLTGSCHCGAVRWAFDGFPNSATACNCTVCRRYGTLWVYDWINEKISVSGETAFYVRGDKDIEFHFCPTCGCNTWWRGTQADGDGRVRVAVNLRLCDDPTRILPIPIRHFDGADTFAPTARDDRCIRDLWF